MFSYGNLSNVNKPLSFNCMTIEDKCGFSAMSQQRNYI